MFNHHVRLVALCLHGFVCESECIFICRLGKKPVTRVFSVSASIKQQQTNKFKYWLFHIYAPIIVNNILFIINKLSHGVDGVFTVMTLGEHSTKCSPCSSANLEARRSLNVSRGWWPLHLRSRSFSQFTWFTGHVAQRPPFQDQAGIHRAPKSKC